MGNIKAGGHNFTQATQRALQDGVLKQTELDALKNMAEKTPEQADNKVIEHIEHRAKDQQDLHLLELPFGKGSIKAIPLFKYDNDRQHPSIADVKSGTTVLSLQDHNMSGEAVQTSQKRLKALGYDVQVTGRFDEKTQKAVNDFQKVTGCCGKNKDAAGTIGKVTWKRLNQMMSTQNLRQNLVQNAQKNTQKYYSGAGVYLRSKPSTQSLSRCYNYVARNADTINRGSSMQGNHAYEAIKSLQKDDRFQEVSVAPKDMPNLPEGAIVVWEKGTSKSGHISIADGKGNEVSDFIQPQWTSHYGGGKGHVFLPIK